MDPVAHVLAGSAIARAGFQRSLPEKRATVIGVLAANIPDLDLVELLWASEEQFVYHHRSLTHSLVGWLVASLIMAWGCRRIWKDMEFRPLYFLISLAYGSHICMDLLTPWGTRVLYPFLNDAFSANITFIWDPGFWLILGAPWLFRRWVPEVRAFRLALVVLGLFVMMCAMSRQVASVSLRHMLNRTQITAHRTDIFPGLLAPVSWNAVAQGETHSYQAFFSLPFGAEEFQISVPHNLGHPAVQALRESHGTEYFLWTRFPVAKVIEEGGGVVRVEIRDLRFARRYDDEIGGFVFKRRLRDMGEGVWQEL